MSHILIVGRKFSGFTSSLEENGHTYTLLRDSRKRKVKKTSSQRVVYCDLSSWQSVVEAIDSLNAKNHIDAVISTYERYIVDAAKIARHLGLPGLPIESAQACTNKFKMRALFKKSGHKISPDFAIVNSVTDLDDFAKTHQFPLILKPTNLAKSLLVTKNHTLDELHSNYKKALGAAPEIYEKYAPDTHPAFLVEEFMEGSIHSVDAFSDIEGNVQVLDNVVDYLTGYDIGFDDNFHYCRLLPSQLSLKQQQTIRKCAKLGVEALGMKNSPAHVEIIMTPEGPRIVEIGARNGGYRERMHGAANGIDIPEAALDTALGNKPNIKSIRNDDCAVLELFPKDPGIFLGVKNTETVKKLPSLSYFRIVAKPDTFVGKAGDGYKACAIIMLHSSDHTQFEKDLSFVNLNVSVVTKPK